MTSSLVDKIIPIYHNAPKKRHDLLCIDLSNDPRLIDLDIGVIDTCVKEIESLISSSVEIARDELYGQITRHEAIQRIRVLSPALNEESLRIIMERATYHASK